jgi:DNA-binding GntR family transcriptional regulator
LPHREFPTDVWACMNTLDAGAVQRKPMKEQVYDVLHENILAGRYAAGSWLRQEEIASQLGVSMTPVREALDLLVSSGLAERVPYKGVRICDPSPSEILEAYGLRLLLEGAAAFSAACKIDNEQLAELWALLERIRPLVALRDMPEERALGRELHSAIVAASGSRLLHKTYLTVLNAFPDWMLYEYLYRQPELLAECMGNEFHEHRLIVDALAGHDQTLALRRTIEHMASRARELESHLGISPEALRECEAQVLPLLQAIQERAVKKETV